MSSFFLRLEIFLNNGKNLYKIFIFLVVFLCIVKLPSVFISDIQPWDEGMYAARVLSIHVNGDFIDQSSDSVGNFYSGSHPPLLIWLGYFVTLIFGMSAISLKLIIFIFSLLCILLILLTGKKLFNASTGFFAALIFCSNIIFTVFSQRFQFDIPYIFFILLSFYLFFLYNDTLNKRYLYLSGLALGCCLMTKILAGFYIPMVIFISYFFLRDKVNFRLKDIFIMSIAGVLIALPWHLYMFSKFGSEFTDYFFKFHLIDRALYGVEMNEKNSGMLYHVNYLLSILPFSVLSFLCSLKYLKNLKKLEWQKTFMLVWFLTGFLILTIFKTKLESYILMILIPGCFLISLFVKEIDKEKLLSRTIILLFTFFNIFWFATEYSRPALKIYFLQCNKFIFLFCILLILSVLFLLSRFIANKSELKKTYYIFILIFFFVINIYYVFDVPLWVDQFKLSGIKKYIQLNKNKTILYVGTNYRYNPQFSFYFNGADLKWINSGFKYEFIDNKEGVEVTRDKLQKLPADKYFIIVEKDYINRTEYSPSESFMPGNARLIMKQNGYELYEKTK